MNVFIDVETVPTTHPAYTKLEDEKFQADVAEYKAPKSYKKAEALAEHHDSFMAGLQAKKVKAWKDTSLDSTWGELLCVVCAVDDGSTHLFERTMAEPEARVLIHLWEYMDARVEGERGRINHPRFIGWNVAFDLEYLWRRSVVCGVKPPFYLPRPLNIHPDSERVLCLQRYWSGFSRDKQKKLKHVCAALNIADEGDIDGADVWGQVSNGNYNAVFEHCIADVNRLRVLAEKMEAA